MSATTDDASRDAHAQQTPNRTNLLRARILLTLRTQEHWRTFDGIRHLVGGINLSPSGVRTRVNELVKLGLVEAVGRTADGKTAWAPTVAGSVLRDEYQGREPRDLALDPRIWFDQKRPRRVRFETVLVDPALIPAECQPVDVDRWVGCRVRVTIDLLEEG